MSMNEQKEIKQKCQKLNKLRQSSYSSNSVSKDVW